MILFRIIIYEKDQKLLLSAFNHSFPMCITDFNHTIIEGNTAYWETFNRGKVPKHRIMCYENWSGEFCRPAKCTLKRIQRGEMEITCEQGRMVNGKTHYYNIKAKPVLNTYGEVIGCIESFDDITLRKSLEREKQELIKNLQQSLEQVKILKGMLPLCPSCKQVRNDVGYWDRIESYLADNTEAEILPCLCPECRALSRLKMSGSEAVPPQSGNRVTNEMLKIADSL
ncbi:MAG: PAS domain-containing protein [Desulfobulbaceae bacterium]|nr:PAS domain-containing protein [Desulfobulbaceae bacterium]